SGVIPPIFASSLILFPATASTWFSNASQMHWLQQLTTALSPGEPPYMILYAHDHHLCVLLHRDRVQLAGNRGQPEALGCIDSGLASGQSDRRLHRRRADPPDGRRRDLPRRRVPDSGLHADGVARAVLFRRDLAADRGGGGDGFPGPGVRASGVAPVRKFAEKGQPAAGIARAEAVG